VVKKFVSKDFFASASYNIPWLTKFFLSDDMFKAVFFNFGEQLPTHLVYSNYRICNFGVIVKVFHD